MGHGVQGNIASQLNSVLCRKVLPSIDLKLPVWEILKQMRKRLAWRPLKN